MTILEQLARYLAARLNLPFEGDDPAGAVFYGYLPERPVRAVCVYADDLRPGGGEQGAAVQIAVRSDVDGEWPLQTGLAILRALDERRDLLPVAGGDYISRIRTERGFEFGGLMANNTQVYTATFRVYTCGGEGAL